MSVPRRRRKGRKVPPSHLFFFSPSYHSCERTGARPYKGEEEKEGNLSLSINGAPPSSLPLSSPFPPSSSSQAGLGGERGDGEEEEGEVSKFDLPTEPHSETSPKGGRAVSWFHFRRKTTEGGGSDSLPLLRHPSARCNSDRSAGDKEGRKGGGKFQESPFHLHGINSAGGSWGKGERDSERCATLLVT